MKTKNKVIILSVLILIALFNIYSINNQESVDSIWDDGVLPILDSVDLAVVNFTLFDKSRIPDKKYRIDVKLDSKNNLTEGTYYLPSDCEEFLEDYSKAHDFITRGLVYWNGLCGFYLKHIDKVNQEAEHDFVSSINFDSLPLDEFPFPCDHGIFSSYTWDRCINSIRIGKRTIMDMLVSAVEDDLDSDLVDGAGLIYDNLSIDKSSCRFANSKGPRGIFYNEPDRTFYCGAPNKDKKYINHGESPNLSPPPFSKSFSFSDYNSDGYMDIALTYDGGNVVILTKKSKEGKLERILFED